MNLHHLKVFYAVAKTLSFTKAADELFLTQPAVTQQVKTLEDYYDVKLFNRTRRHVGLTEAGLELYAVASKIFDLAEHSEDMLMDYRGMKWGTIRVDASFTFADFYFPKIYTKFHLRYPQIDVICNTGNTSRVLENTINRQNDIAFVAYVHQTDKLVKIDYLKDRLVPVAAPTHPLAGKGSITPKDLDGQSMLLREVGSSPRRILDSFFEAHRVKPIIILESGSTAAIKKAVEDGTGLSILSRQTVEDEIKSGTLCELRFNNTELYYGFYLTYHKDRFLSRGTRAFLDVAMEMASRFHD
jgi:DNA-binding transcriptional LysR family regulator